MIRRPRMVLVIAGGLRAFFAGDLLSPLFIGPLTAALGMAARPALRPAGPPGRRQRPAQPPLHGGDDGRMARRGRADGRFSTIA